MNLLRSNFKSPYRQLPWWPDRWQILLSDSDCWFHLVTFNTSNKVIVLAKCSVQCSENKEDVFVPVVNRGHGYALVLLRLVLERLDCFAVHVQAASDNVPANKTYEKVFGAPCSSYRRVHSLLL
jgi:hypothetical protein